MTKIDEKLEVKLNFFRPFITKTITIESEKDLEELFIKYQKQPGFVFMEVIGKDESALRFNDINKGKLLELNGDNGSDNANNEAISDLYGRINTLESTITDLQNVIAGLEKTIAELNQ